jgi:formylglycine-generating enzyme required for sulfatase activity
MTYANEVKGLITLSSIMVIISLAACVGTELERQTPESMVVIHADTRKTSVAVNSNDSWSTHIEEIGGVRMALVPPGCFKMGITEAQAEYLIGLPGSSVELEYFRDQMPIHEVCFKDAFWIDVFEVTQGQFRELMGEANLQSYFQGNDLPREQITWMEADKFCEQRGARLPTEAEWEYAARGPDSLLFPWGNVFDCRMGNFDDTEMDDPLLIVGSPNCDGFSTTSSVGSIKEGASWVGATDLIGNVWEWVWDRYDARYYESQEQGSINPSGPITGDRRVVRGGAWSINEVDHLSAAFRGGIDPGIAIEHLGFRCAKSSD